MKSFITGIHGFVGNHLTQYLKTKGHEVSGIDQAETCAHADKYYKVDMRDSEQLCAILSDIQPDYIFHLAGLSFVPDNASTPKFSIDITVMGAASLLDAVKKAVPGAITLMIGSLKEYGLTGGESSIDESTVCRPIDFYGISKYAAELIGQQYSRQFDIDIRHSRSFNHTGPGQSNRFVCSDWAYQCALVAKGLQKPEIQVGDLDQEIDFLDVRDVVEAYYTIVTNGTKNQIYNVCSGTTTSLRWILSTLSENCPLTITHAVKPERLRAGEIRRISRGNPAKLFADTGWKPAIPLSQTMADLFAYWYERV